MTTFENIEDENYFMGITLKYKWSVALLFACFILTQSCFQTDMQGINCLVVMPETVSLIHLDGTHKTGLARETDHLSLTRKA